MEAMSIMDSLESDVFIENVPITSKIIVKRQSNRTKYLFQYNEVEDCVNAKEFWRN